LQPRKLEFSSGTKVETTGDFINAEEVSSPVCFNEQSPDASANQVHDDEESEQKETGSDKPSQLQQVVELSESQENVLSFRDQTHSSQSAL